MANALQLRRGTTTQHSTFTGLAGEVTVDTTKDTIVVHDGSTAGGIPLATEDSVSAANLLTAIKTVDGAGSGLDADLLDGQTGTYYTNYADTAVANLVASAPSTLDTLNELAAALGDDPNFATTVTNSIATKMPLAGGTFTGDVTFSGGASAITLPAGSDIRATTGSWTGEHSGKLQYHDSDWYIQFADQMIGRNGSGTNVFTVNSSGDGYFANSLQIAGGTAWHSGNDGSGSGLDADTLDGVQLANIARTDIHEDFGSSVSFSNAAIDPDGYGSGKSGGFGAINDGSGWSAPGLFVTGGAGKAATFAAASGNIYFGTQDGSNTNSMSSWLTVTQSTKTASFDGKVIFNQKAVVENTLDIEEVVEKVQTSTSTSGTIVWYSNAQGIVYYTSNQTANRTINFVGDGSTSMNSFLGVGQSYTASLVMTQGSTAYYLNAYQVDGSAVTPKWSGGSAPTQGNASGIDVYTFTIIKTANATFTVLASLTQYA